MISVYHYSNRHAYYVTEQIAPQKAETQHQSAQPPVPQIVDPGSMVQLAELDAKREKQCGQDQGSGGPTVEHQRETKEYHQRPQDITHVGPDKEHIAKKLPRCQTKQQNRYG